MTIPSTVVALDRRLDQSAENSTLALARHRWHNTLDPDGPGYSTREYARAVDRNMNTIARHAHGYAMFVERAEGDGPGPSLTLEDAFRLAGQSAEQRAFSEAIADGLGEPVGRVARGDNHQRRHIIEHAHDRAERRGTDPIDEARTIAREIVADRAHRAERDATRRNDRTLALIEIEGHVAAARRRLTQAVQAASNANITDTEIEMLRQPIDALRHVLDLLDLRMTDTPDVDWDGELARLQP